MRAMRAAIPYARGKGDRVERKPIEQRMAVYEPVEEFARC